MKKLIAALGISFVTVASACGDDTTATMDGGTPDGSTSGTSGGATGSSGTSGATGTTGASGGTGTAGTTSGTSGSTAASCNQAFTPCGGDVTGTWTIASDCILISVDADAGCAGETGTVAVQSGAQTITFSAGAYSLSAAQGTSSETLTIPIACLSVAGLDAGTLCDEESLIFEQADGGTTGSCMLSASSCTCSGTTTSSSDAASGTYVLSGNTVMINPADGGAATAGSYCVQGNTLYVDASAMGGSSGTAGSFIVLTKQ
jgi:collagen type VII alpha